MNRAWSRRNALVLALLATVSLSACGGDKEDSDQGAGAPDASAPSTSPSPASGDQNASAPASTPIRVSVGDTELTARLSCR